MNAIATFPPDNNII